MLLSELEPGTAFKLTAKSLKDEKERLARAYFTTPDQIVISEGYEIIYPQQKTNDIMLSPLNETRENLQMAEVRSLDGKFNHFMPSLKQDPEVEVITRPYLGNSEAFLPTRGWLNTSCDPEVFLEKDGQILPGFAVLPSKKKPYVDEEWGVYHEDGFQAEFSPTPRACHEEVVRNIGQIMQRMSQSLPSGTRISDASFIELDAGLLATGTDAQVSLGCDPSENVWGHTWFTHDKPREFPFRMAGGHIHLGTPHHAKWFHSRAERIIKAMDLFCGVPSVALLAGLEDPRRRQFYGRAGEFRYQKHGLEYRVLSNAWLQNQYISHLTLNLARGAFRIGCTNWEPEFKYDSERVRQIINEHDVAGARAFIEEHAKILIWMLDQDSGYTWGRKALTTIHRGAKEIFGWSLGIHRTWIEDEVRIGDTFQRYITHHRVNPWPVEEPKEGVPRSRGARPPLYDRFTRPGELIPVSQVVLDDLATIGQASSPTATSGTTSVGWFYGVLGGTDPTSI